MSAHITKAMMGADGAGLAPFVKEIQTAFNKYTVRQQKESAGCKTTVLVLGLITLFCAAASVTCLVINGGSLTKLFIPGLIFGALALGLIIGIIAKVRNTMNASDALLNDYEAVAKKGVNRKKILAAMEQSSVAQISAALNEMGDGKTEFAQHVSTAYWSLSSGKKQVFEALAKTGAAKGLDLQRCEPEFSLELLRGTDPSAFADQEERAFLEKLLTEAVEVEHIRKEQLKAFARHPQAVAFMAQTKPNAYTPDLIRGIVAQMDTEQKTAFLKQMSTGMVALKERAATTQRDTSEQQEVIHRALQAAFAAILQLDLAAQFKCAPLSPDLQQLLEQIALWPKVVAQVMIKRVDLMTEESFMDALFVQMNEKRCDAYVNVSVRALKQSQPLPTIAAVLNSKEQVSVFIALTFRKFPIEMAKVYPSLSLENRGKVLEIFVCMESESQLSFLEEATKGPPQCFDEIFLNLAYGQKNLTPTAGLISYLNAHSKDIDFVNLILKANYEVAEGARYELFLAIVEQMSDQAAKEVINSLDDGSYNKAANRLQAASCKKDVANASARLMSRFRYAPDGSGSRFDAQDRPKDGTVWDNFNNIALANKESVWGS